MAKIKICGLFREEDINYVNEVKPDFAGFVINYPKSHRSLTEARLKQLRADLSPHITAVGVFVNEPVETVARLLNEGVISVAQLHGDESEEYIAVLRALTGKNSAIIKAFVSGESGVTAKAIESCSADYVMYDGGRGGGRLADDGIIEKINRPFFLAGGLTPENIGANIARFLPYAVDISSGVETDKIKDYDKIKRAVRAARGG